MQLHLEGFTSTDSKQHQGMRVQLGLSAAEMRMMSGVLRAMADEADPSKASMVRPLCIGQLEILRVDTPLVLVPSVTQ